MSGQQGVRVLHCSAIVLGSWKSSGLRESRHLDGRLAVGREALLYGSSTGMALPAVARVQRHQATVGAHFGDVGHLQGSPGSGRRDVLRADSDLEVSQVQSSTRSSMLGAKGTGEGVGAAARSGRTISQQQPPASCTGS